MPAVLLIAGRRYALRPAPPPSPWLLRCYELRREGAAEGYLLTQSPALLWSCTCPAFRFGGGMPCKHARKIEEIMSENNDLTAAPATGLIQAPGERETTQEDRRAQMLAELDRPATDPNIAERKKLFWCNFPIGTPAGAALLLKCATPDFKADDMIGQQMELYGVYAAPVLIASQEDGEVVPCLRTVLVLWGGKTIGFVSKGIADSLADLMAGFGKGPWNPPLKVRLRQVALSNGHRTYRLELPSEDAIAELFRLPGPAPKQGRKG